MSALDILKIFSGADIKHGLTLFNEEEIKYVNDLIELREDKYYIKCQIKDKFKVAKPEEVVRQLWIYKLLTEFGYSKNRIDVEGIIYFGSRVEPGAADIVVFHEDLEHHYILFEIKRPKRKDGLEQLKGYCNAEGVPIGIWSNGNEMIRLHREEPNIFIEIPRIPKFNETLRDILTKRWTLGWLEENDELKKGRTTLKKILLDLEELVLGNAGVDPFEEIFKLIYSKLYDEWKGINDPNYQLEFFVGDRSPEQIKISISNLLNGSKRQWSGIFEPTDRIELRDDHLKICVSFLEKIKLFNSNLQIIDEAFEYLIPQVSKKKEGQFFTPRPVIDMIVHMLNPKADEFILDPACGSAGFLLHSVMWVAKGGITGKDLPPSARNFAQNNIYGIDFAKKAVKIAKAINLIVGDGKSHIFKDNSLAPYSWNDETKAGLRPRLLRFRDNSMKDSENQEKFTHFDFDVLMTNPPFAGTIKERNVLRLYSLSERKGKLVKKIGRHILFIDRSIQFIRPGGRMGIILPQGLLNNINMEYIRSYFINEARILGIIGLHVNTFKPFTGTKTSVVLLLKHTVNEKEELNKIILEYADKADSLINKFKEHYFEVDWDAEIINDFNSDILYNFIESYFDRTEDINNLKDEDDGKDDDDSSQESYDSSHSYISLNKLYHLLNNINQIISDKNSESNTNISDKRKTYIKNEIKILKKQVRKIINQLRERTLGGQIYLTLNKKKIEDKFKKYWIEKQLYNKINYKIFMGINEEPVKNNSGEYRYTKGSDENLILDSYGHPIILHDLNEIAKSFEEFSKKQNFDFWR